MKTAIGIRKLYYSIGEVAEIVGEEPHVLRFWETEFEELSPRRNRGRRRIYTPDDLAVVERIRYLVKVEKYTLEGAKQAMRREKERDSSSSEYRHELRQLRSFLENIRRQLDVHADTGRSAAR